MKKASNFLVKDVAKNLDMNIQKSDTLQNAKTWKRMMILPYNDIIYNSFHYYVNINRVVQSE